MGIFDIFAHLTNKPTLQDHQLLIGKYHEGNVRCEYVQRGGEKVFDGPFVYEYKFGSLFSDKGMERAEGTFDMNRKQGPWHMEYHTKQHDKELTTNFERGRVEGALEYRCTERDYLGRTSNTYLSFNVEDGHVTGEIRGLLGGKKFSGYCDQEGYPDGQWEVEVVSSDATLSHTDCEMWSHGELMSSYSKNKQKNSQSELCPYLRKTFSELVNGDVMDMLFMVRRGTQMNKIEVPYKEHQK